MKNPGKLISVLTKEYFLEADIIGSFLQAYATTLTYLEWEDHVNKYLKREIEKYGLDNVDLLEIYELIVKYS